MNIKKEFFETDEYKLQYIFWIISLFVILLENSVSLGLLEIEKDLVIKKHPVFFRSLIGLITVNCLMIFVHFYSALILKKKLFYSIHIKILFVFNTLFLFIRFVLSLCFLIPPVQSDFDFVEELKVMYIRHTIKEFYANNDTKLYEKLSKLGKYLKAFESGYEHEKAAITLITFFGIILNGIIIYLQKRRHLYQQI